MRIFKVDYEYAPGDMESSVVIAATEERVKEMVENEEFWRFDRNKYTIDEIALDEGIVYTGYNCC